MAPFISTQPYTLDDSELQLHWSKEDLQGYSCLEQQEAVADQDDDQEGTGFFNWHINEEHTHAILTFQREGDPTQSLLINLHLEERHDVPRGLVSDRALQVSSVFSPETDEDYSGQGLARSLYAVIARCLDVLVVSDTHHHIPGKALWQSLAHNDGHPIGCLQVYIYNTQTKQLFRSEETGEPLVYDGSNIPEDSIWSFNAHGHIVLVAKYTE